MTVSNPDELATDVESMISHFMNRVEFQQPDADEIGGPLGMMAGVDPELLISQVTPLVSGKIESNPEESLRAAAILHLETGALIEKHAARDPIEIAEARPNAEPDQ